ncbi:MAG TPA: FAD-dependent oxidoreductase, partial [Gemmatimonadaceae bacterium]|nr:FAD-dependent oxidoreductase [Gemmatimonadaceae bacterium]
MPDTVHDVAIVGGSFAGLSAAMQLARARRRVLVIDAGRPRNRFAHASHGFLGQDGRTPAEILETARAQLLAYPTAELRRDEATRAGACDGGFEVVLA